MPLIMMENILGVFENNIENKRSELRVECKNLINKDFQTLHLPLLK
jgi:hypothetical protein